MGDRTYTSITVPKAFEEIVDLWIESESGYVRKENGDNKVVVYADEDANYGNIEWLERLLEENAIPYDKEWQRGGNYEPGEKAVRSQRAPNEELVIETLEWDEPEEFIELRQVAELLNLGAVTELASLVRGRLKRVTPGTDLKEAVFFEEHGVLLERLRHEKLDRERNVILAAQQTAAHNDAESNCDLIVEAAMVVTELIYDKGLDHQLLAEIDEYRKEVGVMQLRHDIRSISDGIQRSFNVTEKAADGSWDRCYDYDWMPAFLKATLRFDFDNVRMFLDDNFIRVAWEIGLAHKENREPDFDFMNDAATVE